jgi:drug/metabolite transporter (DMT)-like permease
VAVWAAFWTLGLIWGSSFLLIKFGVAELTPLQLVACRVGMAALAMVLTLRFTGRHFPADLRSRLGLIVVGMFNTAIPFLLITWGEQSIDSGLATVLNATVPLFSLVIAHFALQDERITGMKLLGLLSGFIGVVVLASRSLGVGEVANPLAGQVAVLLASMCYAGATVFVRRNLRHLPPMVVSSGALVTAAVLVGGAALLVDGLPAFGALSTTAIFSVGTLGLANTYVAYLLFYWIISRWGATRATLVTYVMPPVGLALGGIFLAEPLDTHLLLGTALIGAGVALVTLRLRCATPPESVEALPVAATPCGK